MYQKFSNTEIQIRQMIGVRFFGLKLMIEKNTGSDLFALSKVDRFLNNRQRLVLLYRLGIRMKLSFKIGCLICASGAVLSSCHKKPESVSWDTTSDESFLATADESSHLLMKRLSEQLKTALAAGGEKAALQVCQQVAQPLTNTTNTELDGITVTRVALKVRNPENEPSDQDRQVMEKWLQVLRDEKGDVLKSEVVRNTNGSVFVYKPIFTQEVCLRCHGDSSSFSDEFVSLLDNYYPNDQATGFTQGSLRGAFKITFTQP